MTRKALCCFTVLMAVSSCFLDILHNNFSLKNNFEPKVIISLLMKSWRTNYFHSRFRVVLAIKSDKGKHASTDRGPILNPLPEFCIYLFDPTWASISHSKSWPHPSCQSHLCKLIFLSHIQRRGTNFKATQLATTLNLFTDLDTKCAVHSHSSLFYCSFLFF